MTQNKLHLDFGVPEELFPEGYVKQTIDSQEEAASLIDHLDEKLDEAEIKMSILSAYSPGSILDLSAATMECNATLIEFKNNIKRRVLLDMILNLMKAGFVYSIETIHEEIIPIKRRKKDVPKLGKKKAKTKGKGKIKEGDK